MSYTVDIDTTPYSPTESDPRHSLGISVTTFWGGSDNGRMVQISLGGEYVTMDMKTLKQFRKVCKFAQKQSLADWPE